MDPSLALKKEKMDFLGMPKIKLLVWPLSFQDNKKNFVLRPNCYILTTILNKSKIDLKEKMFWLAINWLKNTIFFQKMDREIDRSEIFKFWSKDLLKLLQLSVK